MTRKAPIGVTALAALVALVTAAPSTSAQMQSVELGNKVCQTTGGGKIVGIPGFPGERIDQRLLNDIKYLRRKYEIFITDGYSIDPVHSANGEHPRGVALDITPNFAAGGDWNDIDRLAKWAEPNQNQPRSPFRWVGYNGDSGHGRGHHLHLSYSHSGSAFGKTPKTVYSVRCPGGNSGGGGGGPEEPDRGDGDGNGGKGGTNDGGGNGGGVTPGGGGGGNGGGGDNDGGSNGGGGDGNGGNSSGGGISPRTFDQAQLAPVHPETAGVDG